MAASREKVVQNAERFVSRGKIDAAIKEYRKLLAENPNDISTLNRVGDLYARIHRNGEAIDLFTQIAEQYADDGFFVKSIAIYKKIIKLDPTQLEVYEKLADLYHRQGLVNEARTQYLVLADYYLKHDRAAAAVGIYRRLAELEPDDPTHHVKLAELFRREGRLEEAIGEYRAIADLMLQHGKGAEAARVFERALDVDAEDLGFITDAVLKLKEGGHVGPAAHFLALAVARNPKAERVARIAGLPERAAPEAAPAPMPEAAEPGPVPELEPAPEAESEPRAAGQEAAGEPPAGFGAPPPGLEPEPLPELFPEGSLDGVFELDLDEEAPESLVTPPPDMAEDRERRGAAWAQDDRAAGAEPGPAEPPPAEPAPAGPAPAGPAREPTVTGTFEFELDLEADGRELLEAVDEVAAVPSFSEGLDHDLLERTAAEVQPDRVSEPEDLLTEAEVLAKYGIEEKALERLAELLQREPDNLEAFRLMLGIHLEAGRHDRVAAVAGRMGEVAERLDDRAIWPEVRGRLEGAGYRVEPGRIEPPAGAVPETEAMPEAGAGAEVVAAEEAPPAAAEAELDLSFDVERFELPELSFETLPEAEAAAEVEEPAAAEPEEPAPAPPVEAAAEPEEPAPAPPAVEEPPVEAPVSEKGRRRRGDLDAALAELAGQFLGRRRRRPEAPVEEAPEVPPEAPPEEAPAPPPPPPAAPPSAPVDPLRALGESLRDEIDRVEEGPAAEPEPALAAASDLEDTGTSWLDEVSAAAAERKALADEADFFDLGAELEQELSAEGGLEEDELLLGPIEQSLEEIVEGFKRGVAESLSPEDYDTHFNLGIAYREMGLVDEAIGEFQLAAKEPSYLVPCASMLGLCFIEKGLPELAVKWYQRGLQAPEISDEDRLGLLYDLGDAQLAAGDRKAAYHAFVDAYGLNTNFRDVVARLTELEPRTTD